MSDVSRLAEWIGEQLEADATCARLVMAHVTKGNRLGDEIRTVTVGKGDDQWAHETAARLIDQAAREAATLEAGAQRYAVLAFFADAEGKPETKSRARHLFTVAAPEGGDKLMSTVTPDETGLVALAQQNAQFFAKLASTQTLAQITALQAEVAALRKENEDLRKARLKSFEVLEELYSARATQELERMKEASKARIWEGAAEKVEMLIPMALNHLAGKKVFPDDVAAVLAAKTLVDKLTAEEVTQIGTIIGPEKLAMLIHLGTTVSRLKPDEAAAGAGAIAKTPNGVRS